MSKLKECRIKKKWSQQYLSEISGVSRGIIINLENGKESVTTTRTLKKLANALSVSVCDII